MLCLVKSILTDTKSHTQNISVTKSYDTEVYLRTVDVQLEEKKYIKQLFPFKKKAY